MKEQDAVVTILDKIVAASGLLAESDVRTTGGDQDLNPPEVIVEWDASRLSGYNGANNFGAFTTDESGDHDGREYHNYYSMTVTCTVRSYDEKERDDLINTIQETFMPYEFDSSAFDADTAEWDVGLAQPRQNPAFEPDWYEMAVPLTFVLLRRTTDTGDTLTTIQRESDDELVDETLEDGEVNIT